MTFGWSKADASRTLTQNIVCNMAEAAQSQRNFRSAYLEKVGIKGVEEKKSLEILLKEIPLDIKKLREFCLRFPVPATYRGYLWKVLLGKVTQACLDLRPLSLSDSARQFRHSHVMTLADSVTEYYV